MARGALTALAGVALFALALLTALFALGKWEPSNPLAASSVSRPSAASKPVVKPPAKTDSATPAPSPGSREVRLQLVPEGQVWTCLVDAKGRRLVAGKMLEAGAATRTYRSKSFRVSFGNASVAMRIDGRRHSVSGAQASVGYAVTRAGRRALAPAQQPSCAQAAPASPPAQG